MVIITSDDPVLVVELCGWVEKLVLTDTFGSVYKYDSFKSLLACFCTFLIEILAHAEAVTFFLVAAGVFFEEGIL